MNIDNDYWKEIQGWFSDVDRLIYAGAIARYGRGAKFVEVGAWKGRSFASVLPLAKSLGYKQAVAVDTFLGSASEMNDSHKEALTVNIKEQFEDNIRKTGCTDIVHTIPENSIEASTYFPDEYFDVVFIDAEHTYDAVKRDIETWLPKVKTGGILIGHDWLWDTVSSAVIDTLSPHGPQHVCENMWWYFK